MPAMFASAALQSCYFLCLNKLGFQILQFFLRKFAIRNLQRAYPLQSIG